MNLDEILKKYINPNRAFGDTWYKEELAQAKKDILEWVRGRKPQWDIYTEDIKCDSVLWKVPKEVLNGIRKDALDDFLKALEE